MLRQRQPISAIALFAIVLCAAVPATAQSAYTVQGIGTHSNGTYPSLVNNAGDVAGTHSPAGQQRAFVYVDGVFRDIGTLGGTYSWLNDINESGVVVGGSYLSGNNNYHAVLFDGTLRDLGTFNSNGYSYAYAINASGQVVGYSDGYAFLYSGGVLQKLINLLPAGSGWSSLSEALDINDAGQIIGRGFHASLGWRSFLFTPAVGSMPASMIVLGDGNSYPRQLNASGQVVFQQSGSSTNETRLFTPGIPAGSIVTVPGFGGTSTYPYDLNDAGQVVGYSHLPNNTAYHAFRYSGGQSIDLGTLAGSGYSYATGISETGVIVGYSSGPFVYADGAMRQLTSLMNGCNWSPQDVRAISGSGHIVGYGYDPTFGYRGFLMTPATDQTSTALVASAASGAHRRSITLQARLTAACSSLSGKTVTFSLNGTAVGTAVTDGDGWARLSTNVGAITVGTYPDGISVVFEGDADFEAAADTAALTVSKASPIVAWTPEALVEGTPIGPGQLNAVADTPGTFHYYTPAGTVLGPGLRTLSANFTPTDTTNYYSIGLSALLAVRASNPVVTYTADVGTTGLGGTSMDLLAFNNAGQAVGYAYTPGNNSYRAILYENGVTSDLGTLGGNYARALDISDAGHVTGWAYTANSYQHAFLYADGTMVDLGTPPGSQNNYSEGRAVNAAGDVAAQAYDASGYWHAHLHSAGTWNDLGALSSSNYSYANDVNTSGQVVGYSYVSNCYHAFLATTNGMQGLGTLGGPCSQAIAINDAGQVIGWADNAAGQRRAFLYENGTMTDIGTLGGDSSYAQAISESGIVTGYSYTAGNQSIRAFRYQNGIMTDLGVLNYNQSRGNDVNSAGAIVGWSYSAEGSQTAVLHDGGAMHDLNALINVGETAGVHEARFINDSGQILARGYSANNQRWYVLTPSSLASSALALGDASGTYAGSATLTATLTIDLPLGERVRFLVDGVSVGSAFADANGVATLSVSLAGISAGSHAVSAAYSGNALYAGSTASASLVVAKATPAVNWSTPQNITYGTALSGTQLNASASVGGAFSYSPAAGTVLNAGDTQTLSVTFTPSQSGNYEVVTRSVSINVLKATPGLSWSTPAAIGYGTALSATQLNASSGLAGTFDYSPAAGAVLNAGTQTLSVTFTPANVNYATRSMTVSLVVAKATPAVTWANPAAIAYGTALGATQLNATATVAGAFNYTPAVGTVLTAGNGKTLSTTFTPDDQTNYNPRTVSVTINVLKATPAIAWANPADITYGTALGAAQLNATADVQGTFAYSPAAGTVLNAGQNQLLAVTFTPADTANYSAHSASATLTVARAIPVITWATPAAMTYGTALGAAQLNATADTVGTFSYSPAAGTVLNAGLGQNLAVTFTPANPNNYATATAGVTVTVAKAVPSTSWTTPASIVYGTALGTNQLNATASVGGTFAYTPAIGAMLNAGDGQTLSATFTPTDTGNYQTTTATVLIDVAKANVSVTWANPAGITYGTALGPAQLDAAASVVGTFAYTPAAGTVLNAGDGQTLSVTFTPDSSTNFNPATTTVLIDVAKATPALVWAPPGAITYGTALGAAQLNASSSVPGAFAYLPATGTVLGAGAGQTLSATFTPSDESNYTTATATVAITVTKATPSVTWASPVPITFGTALTDAQLNAAASVAGTFAYTPASGTVLTTGTHSLSTTFTPSDAGNYNPVTATTQLAVVHTWSNLLQPIDADGSSIFKLGSTIPTKFALTGGSAGVTNLVARLYVSKVSNSVTGDELEAASTSAADSGNQFRYDPSGGIYIFNLSTKSLSQGTWQLRVDFGDGVSRTMLISLKK